VVERDVKIIFSFLSKNEIFSIFYIFWFVRLNNGDWRQSKTRLMRAIVLSVKYT